MFKGALYYFVMCWQLDKRFPVVILLKEILNAVKTVMAVVLPKFIIDALFTTQNKEEAVKFVFEEPKQKKDSETIVISTKIPSKSDPADFLEKAAGSENTVNETFENKKKKNIDITIQTPDGKTQSFNL